MNGLRVSLWTAIMILAAGSMASGADLGRVAYVTTPSVEADVIVDARTLAQCQKASLPGARCLPADDFLGPHNRLTNISGLLWLLGTAGLTGQEHVLVAGDDTGRQEFLGGLLHVAGQREVSILAVPIERLQAPQSELQPGVPRTSTREVVFKAPMRADRLVLRHELAVLLASDTPPTLLDGRGEAEYWGQRVRSMRGGHLPGAQHLAADTLAPTSRPDLPSGYVEGVVAYAHDALEGFVYLARLLANGVDTRLFAEGWSGWASDGTLPADSVSYPDLGLLYRKDIPPVTKGWFEPWMAVGAAIIAGASFLVGGFCFGRLRRGRGTV